MSDMNVEDAARRIKDRLENKSTGLTAVDRQNNQDALRFYGIGAQILRRLGIRDMRLLTNLPRKIKGLDGYDLNVVECVSTLPWRCPFGC